MTEREVDEIIYRFGDFELFPRDRMLLRAGERVSLTPRMFDLLKALIDADGHLVRKEVLLETVWSDAAVEEGNLNRTISALRKALGESRNEIRFIETVPKAGYRFIAKVESSNGLKRARQIEHVSSAPESDVVDPSRVEGSFEDKKKGLPFAAIAAIGAFLLLFGLLMLSYFIFNRRPPAPTTIQHAGPIRLTNNGFDEDSAMWTGDDQIRFIRFTAVNKVESMIMDADGSNQRRAGTEVRDLRAGTWSPDGKRVIFSRVGENPYTPFVANADGTDVRPLGFPIGPMDWSPDGTKIVYNTSFPTETSSSEIVIYSFETGERTNISNNPAFDANPSFSPDGQQVIFNSDRDGNAEIYLMNVDGTGVRRLTNDPAKEAFQAFSPDGTQIVFNSNRDNEKVGIFMLNVNDSSPPVKLSDTRFNAEIRPGCWSRDGTRIVYMSDADGEKYNTYAMAVEPVKPNVVLGSESGDIRAAVPSPDGETFVVAAKVAEGGELRLVDVKSRNSKTLTTSENYDLAPVWSPDGTAIAFAMKSGGNTEIFTINADGTGLQNLTQHGSRDGSPAWSSDSTKIIFSSDRNARSEGANLLLMNRDGSNTRRLTEGTGYEMTPSWSLDGSWIAFACDRTDGSSQALDIAVVDGNGEGERIVTSRRFHDSNPNFSPDGRRIVFSSQSDGNFEIYLVNLDGSGLVRLTRNAGDDMMPVFSGDGKKIYFVSNRNGKFELLEMSAPS